MEAEKTSSQDSQPGLTQKELYLELEAKAKVEEARGEKASKMRAAVVEISNEVGRKKLVFKALLPVVRKRLSITITRAHLLNVCEHNWEVAKDDRGLLWVNLGNSKPPRVKS